MGLREDPATTSTLLTAFAAGGIMVKLAMERFPRVLH